VARIRQSMRPIWHVYHSQGGRYGTYKTVKETDMARIRQSRGRGRGTWRVMRWRMVAATPCDVISLRPREQQSGAYKTVNKTVRVAHIHI